MDATGEFVGAMDSWFVGSRLRGSFVRDGLCRVCTMTMMNYFDQRDGRFISVDGGKPATRRFFDRAEYPGLGGLMMVEECEDAGK